MKKWIKLGALTLPILLSVLKSYLMAKGKKYRNYYGTKYGYIDFS